MIAVGWSRDEAGRPVMREKAQPSSERLFYEDGPTPYEESVRMGYLVDGPDIDVPSRRYSHSSADLS